MSINVLVDQNLKYKNNDETVVKFTPGNYTFENKVKNIINNET